MLRSTAALLEVPRNPCHCNLRLPFRLLRQAQPLALLSSWNNCLCHLWWHRELTYTTEVQWMMLSGAPSFNNGGCGQSTVTASQLGLPEFTQRHGADSASKHAANTEERRAHALRQQCPHVMLLLIGRSAHRYRRFVK